MRFKKPYKNIRRYLLNVHEKKSIMLRRKNFRIKAMTKYILKFAYKLKGINPNYKYYNNESRNIL